MTALHLLALFLSLVVIVMADSEGFAWMRGKKQTLDPKRMHHTHLLMWAGLLALILTGIVLFLPRWDYLIYQPLFIMKMLFVAVLLVNAILIGRLIDIALTRSYASLSWNEKLPLLVSGGVSAFSWAGAIVLALLQFGL
jgi:hypothetical protein